MSQVSSQSMKAAAIKDCTNNGTVSGGQYIAGITAVNRGTVSGSVNTAMITASGTFAAGIAADNTSDSKNSGKISRCANSGHVISTKHCEESDGIHRRHHGKKRFADDICIRIQET